MNKSKARQMRVLADKFIEEGVMDVVILTEMRDHIMVLVLKDFSTKVLKRGEFVMTRAC